MKPTVKNKLAMLLSLLNNEFLKLKQEGNFKECIGVEKSIELVKEVFKSELINQKEE